MILIEKRCKNMCIADLFTAHCDSLTELNARGKNAEIWFKRHAHECCFTAQTCVRDLVPLCIKWYLQLTKVVMMMLRRSRSDHPSSKICRLLIFRDSARWSDECNMFCDKNDVCLEYSYSSKAYPVYKMCALKKMFLQFFTSLEELRIYKRKKLWDGRGASESERWYK